MARIIKRYDNRKLYDAENRSYVSLTDIAVLVRDGETVEVVDNSTGKDLTAQILTQIILEEGKQGRELIPKDLLHTLLRRGEDALDAGLDQLRSGVGAIVHSSLTRVHDILGQPAAADIEALRTQLRALEAVLSRLSSSLEGTAESGPAGEDIEQTK